MSRLPGWDDGRWTLPVAAASAAPAVAVRDLTQRQHALLRNFPVIGHARRALESIGPELRQYIVAGDTEERCTGGQGLRQPARHRS